MKSYRSEDWAKFRSEVIKLDDSRCTRCGKGKEDGIVLHVHHKRYHPGRDPWDYTYNECETLCSGCHAAEHGIIAPKFGWEHIGYEDLGDLIGNCEYCGTSIRHVFLVQHEKWMVMEVGEICCNNLTCTMAAGEHMDSIRRFSERQKRFLSSTKWITEGKIHKIPHNKIHLEVIQEDSKFRLRMNAIEGKITFDSLTDAKMKAFELMESDKVREFLKKRQASPK